MSELDRPATQTELAPHQKGANWAAIIVASVTILALLIGFFKGNWTTEAGISGLKKDFEEHVHEHKNTHVVQKQDMEEDCERERVYMEASIRSDILMREKMQKEFQERTLKLIENQQKLLEKSAENDKNHEKQMAVMQSLLESQQETSKKLQKDTEDMKILMQKRYASP